MPKLKPEIKTRWVDALRSGKYKQGRGQLHHTLNENTFCCLGILCDVVFPDLNMSWDAGHENYIPGSLSMPTREINSYCFVDNEFGDAHYEIVVPLYESVGLAHINDNLQSDGYDFNKIADLIEEQF
jgi:hypothetical protein